MNLKRMVLVLIQKTTTLIMQVLAILSFMKNLAIILIIIIVRLPQTKTKIVKLTANEMETKKKTNLLQMTIQILTIQTLFFQMDQKMAQLI